VENHIGDAEAGLDNPSDLTERDQVIRTIAMRISRRYRDASLKPSVKKIGCRDARPNTKFPAMRSNGGARTLQLTRAAVLSTLILAGCHGPAGPSAPEAVVQGSGGWGQGIDMSTDASNVLGELKESRVDFVARYYRDPDSSWPPLSPREAQLLSAQGLKIVAVYEYHSPDPAHFTYDGGYRDAVMAYGEARAVGQPAGSAIYFAADFNAQGDEVGSVVDYFRGVGAGLSGAPGGAHYAVGVYGSGVVCDAVKRAGLARYTWLSNSIVWDGATDYEDWNIMQGTALQGLSFDNDANQARSDYGAFQVSGNGAAPSVDGAGDVPSPARQEQPATSVSVIPSQ
jgi:hypothetical protein